MKASEVKTNSLVWSKKFQKFGQVIGKKSFMCLVLFNNGIGSMWLHPNDLERNAPMKQIK